MSIETSTVALDYCYAFSLNEKYICSDTVTEKKRLSPCLNKLLHSVGIMKARWLMNGKVERIMRRTTYELKRRYGYGYYYCLYVVVEDFD